MINPVIRATIVCPVCRESLLDCETSLRCRNASCWSRFPVCDGIPILLSNRTSTFESNVYESLASQPRRAYGRFKRLIRRWSPRISANFVAAENFNDLRKALLASAERPVVLIVGGAEIGAGIKELLAESRIEFVETDVVIGTRTALVCDAAALPFASSSFDGVIAQAVLEYVPDPAQCVSEIFRVLKPGALVYSEMPFLQGVHGGKHDFTRLTHLGHLRLYRNFIEMKSGPCAGPATALAWSLQHFFLGFVTSPYLRDIVKLLAAVFLFWLKYFDYFLIKCPGGIDGATGTYVLGRKSTNVLSDRELLGQYRGSVQNGAII